MVEFGHLVKIDDVVEFEDMVELKVVEYDEILQ